MAEEMFTRLLPVLQHAYQHAPAVRDIFLSAGVAPQDLHSLSDLDRIPITSKDRLVRLQSEAPPFGGFLAVPAEELQHVFFSPGPIYEPHAAESALMDTVYDILKIAEIGNGDIALNAFSYHLIPSGIALDECLRKLGAAVIPGGVGNADLQVKMMYDLRATVYLGTPSWLMALIKKAEESGFNFRQQFALRKALVSAEPLPPSLRQVLVEQYGLTVTNAYGTAELGFLAYNQEGGLAMRLLESSVVQVANPETGQTVPAGETGEVVVTSYNTTFPLIRLGTGDLAVNLDPRPGDSQQGERAIILVGRVGEAVKVRGMFVHPNQLRFAIAQAGGVAGFQAVVTREGHRDTLTLRVVSADPAADTQALSETLSAAVRSACRMSVDHFVYLEAGQIKPESAVIKDERTWE
ncbi:MAG TPA: AMP-binding protein [Anaerolineales bacterium]|nr:AMP-binding protein [Anaerolineales bacterium]